MTLYIFQTNNRNYETWNISNATTLEPILDGFGDFNPIQHKLLNNDVFTYNKGKVDIINSKYGTLENIAAVLILENNKTYGRENKTTDSKSREGRLLYKCIPDDISLPIFLVPYEIKHIGFSKVLTNLYVTIRFKNWSEKHPHAILSQNIGTVDVLENFYEYQLYCKNLNNSIQSFNKSLNKAIKKYTDSSLPESIINYIHKSYPQFEDRTSWKVFTIDPKGSVDFDDGFSIKKIENKTLLSIYISNVTVWLDFLNLWSDFSERTSTIYLPNRKIPMLPTLLSDCLCSLQAKSRRFAFTMDLIINSEFNIESINFSNSLIKVFKNYVYEEEALLLDQDYTFLFYTSTNLLKKYNYIDSIYDSHDVVSYLMIFMNYNCALELLKNGNGLFRCVSSNTHKNESFPSTLPDNIKQFLKVYGTTSGSYFNPEGKNISIEQLKLFTRHDMLDLDAYIHITSPIRRIVDLLNMITIQSNKLLIHFSPEAHSFYNTWSYKIDYINSSMRSIRQVQNDCNLLSMFHSNNDILNKEYEGYCFDKIISGNKNNLFQYTAYLPELRITSKIITIHDFENYSQHKFKLFLFFNEEKFKKKIRLEIIL